MIKVLLIDDHVLVRIGLSGAIEATDEMTLVGQAGNSLQIVEQYEELKPDVVVIDFRMPEENGVAATRRLLEAHPGARVLLLSVYEGEEDIWRAVKAGVRAYVTKGDDTEELLEGIRTVHAGEAYFPPKIADKIRKRSQRASLSKREAEVLTLIVQGLRNKEISDRLGISLGTVKLHTSKILDKLDVNDRTQAAVIAVHRGIIHLDD